jgi:putative ABC transport system substrate-binding protein
LATPGTISALAARKATSTVPIVCTSADPIGAGLAVSLARPGGNVTGVSLLSGDYSSKWVGLLLAAVPKLRRVAVLSNPGNMAMQLEMSRLNQAAIDLNLTLKRLSVLPDDLEASLAEIVAARFDGLIVTDDSIVLSMTRRIVEITARERIPALFGVHTAARMGGLMSYSVNLFDLWRRAAGYVDRILKGAKPGELPIEQATKITLAINLKTARALDLEIPPSLLAAADEVIE